jgi:hypothetical protein
MNRMTSQDSQTTIGIFLVASVAGQALHWLITPAAHPLASAGRTAAVLAQAILATGGAVWIWRRR